MKRKQFSIIMVLTVFLLSACLKAYDPPVVVTQTPLQVSEVAGFYKGGTLYLEKTLLDSATYKTTDDTSSITLNYYVNDTVFVSINTFSGVTNKRYKVSLYDSLKTTESTTFKFHRTLTGCNLVLSGCTKKVKCSDYQ
jgi:hypothetical protein